MGGSSSLSFMSAAVMMRMVLVEPAPGFQPVSTMTGSPARTKPRSMLKPIARQIRRSTSAVHSFIRGSEVNKTIRKYIIFSHSRL